MLSLEKVFFISFFTQNVRLFFALSKMTTKNKFRQVKVESQPGELLVLNLDDSRFKKSTTRFLFLPPHSKHKQTVDKAQFSITPEKYASRQNDRFLGVEWGLPETIIFPIICGTHPPEQNWRASTATKKLS